MHQPSRGESGAVGRVLLRGCNGLGTNYQVSANEVLKLTLEPRLCFIEVWRSGGISPWTWKFIAPTGQVLTYTNIFTTGDISTSFETFAYGYGTYTAQVDNGTPLTFTIASPVRRPELTVAGMEITPASPSPAGAITISGRFSNVGGTASEAFAWTLTSDGAILASGRVPELAAGATSAIVTWTGQLTTGTHQVAFSADTADEISELFEVNNTRTQTLNVGGGAVDLVSEIFVDPSPPRESIPAKISGRIRNQGTNASPPFDWRLTRDGTVLASGRQPSLAAGATLSDPIQWTGLVPAFAYQGFTGAKLEADSSSEIVESSELNNSPSLVLNVLPRSDLAVTDLTVTPAQALESTVISVTGAITNRSYAAFGPFSWTLTIGQLPPITGQASSLAAGAVLPVNWSGRFPAGSYGVNLEVTPGAGATDSFPANNSRRVGVIVAGANCVPVKVTSAQQEIVLQIGRAPSFRASLDGTAPIQVIWYRGAVGDTSTRLYDEGPEFLDAPLYTPATYWIRASNACGKVDARIATIAFAPPVFTATSVVNAASGVAGLVPGSLATIYGTGFSTQPGIQLPDTAPLPQSLSGTRVELNGIKAPLLMVADVRDGAQQINFQVPWELPADSTATISVFRDTAASAPVSVATRASQPGIFLTAPRSGTIVHADYQLVTPLNPSHPGETLIAFLTGLGPVAVLQATGVATAGAPSTLQSARVRVAGQNARLFYSGLAPGFIGLYQVNFEVPPSTAPGEWPLVVTLGVDSNEVTLEVQ